VTTQTYTYDATGISQGYLGAELPEQFLQPRQAVDPTARAAVKSALEWFAAVFRSRLAQLRPEEGPDVGEVFVFV
jgi:hypothetical protein